MSDRPTAANRCPQNAPVPAVETRHGEIKTFATSEDAERYARKHGGKDGQLIHGEVIR